MTTKEALEQIVSELPEDRLTELLDFARFLNWQDERGAWQQFGQAQLARAYGPNEPEYTIEEVSRESAS
jgi:hypothetical protein